MMRSKIPAIPNVTFGISDVREVALAHVLALSKDEARGKRFIVCKGSLPMPSFVQIASDAMPELNIPVRKAPNWLAKMVAPVAVRDDIGIEYNLDGSLCERVLGISYMETEKTILEMMQNMEELGALDQKSTNCVIS